MYNFRETSQFRETHTWTIGTSKQGGNQRLPKFGSWLFCLALDLVLLGDVEVNAIIDGVDRG